MVFGAQVLLEFGVQLETVTEENLQLAQRLGEKKKRKPSRVGLEPHMQLQPVTVAKKLQADSFFMNLYLKFWAPNVA